MPSRNILLADTQESTFAFLEQYFEETESELFQATSSEEAGELLESRIPSLVFVSSCLFTPRFQMALRAYRQKQKAKVFGLGETGNRDFQFDALFQTPLELKPFQKQLLDHFRPRQPVKVLIVDDEAEICVGLKEFLEQRRRPPFEVDYALNGLEGIQKVEVMRPDCVLLDLKMPVMNGPELYRELRRSYPSVRTIIVSSLIGIEEVDTVRRWGTPVIIEKESPASGYPDLTLEIEKQLVFS